MSSWPTAPSLTPAGHTPDGARTATTPESLYGKATIGRGTENVPPEGVENYSDSSSNGETYITNPRCPVQL